MLPVYNNNGGFEGAMIVACRYLKPEGALRLLNLDHGMRAMLEVADRYDRDVGKVC